MEKNPKDYLHLYMGCELEGAITGAVSFLTPGLYNSADMDAGLLKLALRPLSDITEQEAIEVAKLAAYRWARHYQPEEISYEVLFDEWRNGTVIIKANGRESFRIGWNVKEVDGIDAYEPHYKTNDVGKHFYAANQFEITRYLLSRGFDLFNLIEAGLAVKKIPA